MRFIIHIAVLLLFSSSVEAAKDSPKLSLNSSGYLEMPGLNVTVFADSFPEGHQGGITIIQNGRRVASNGDLRLETLPGPLSPTPKIGVHTSDLDSNQINQILTYPDPSRNGKGFNPISYPDVNFSYKISVRATHKNEFLISVDLSKPLPKEWENRVGFNLEFYPKTLVGKSFLTEQQGGSFPQQPLLNVNEPLAEGQQMIIAAEEETQRIKIVSSTNPLSLWDARGKYSDGWFIVRSLVKPNTTQNAIVWTVTANTVSNWQSKPVIQVSQVGYALKQTKTIVIEQDIRDSSTQDITIYELTSNGKQAVFKNTPKPWGRFLRYQYFTLDFSYLDKPGVYIAEYKGQQTNPFTLSNEIYNQQVWQPTLEYFLPIQMCHMRVTERDLTWHDNCHLDDAVAAPDNHNHFHGYFSSATPLTKFKSKEPIPNLNAGGWHSGDLTDLEISSQLETIWLLSAMIEEFELDYDSSSIDQLHQTVMLKKPDGVSDALQQIEHGVINTLNSYETLGHLYHGIIAPNNEQFTQRGELSFKTTLKNKSDDRWVFIDDKPDRVLEAAGSFAAAARVLQKYNPDLAKRALSAASNLYIEGHTQNDSSESKIFALTELYLSTQKELYLNSILEMKETLLKHDAKTAWRVARVMPLIADKAFREDFDKSVLELQKKLDADINDNPYKIPYRKSHRGIAKKVLDFGVQQYFLHKAWPQHITSEGTYNAINFILGVHPGANTASFVAGVGSHSFIKGQSVNQTEGPYVPGAVIAGTGIVQPDLPELLDWPFLKQQSEYNISTATAFMFLAMAANQLSH